MVKPAQNTFKCAVTFLKDKILLHIVHAQALVNLAISDVVGTRTLVNLAISDVAGTALHFPSSRSCLHHFVMNEGRGGR